MSNGSSSSSLWDRKYWNQERFETLVSSGDSPKNSDLGAFDKLGPDSSTNEIFESAAQAIKLLRSSKLDTAKKLRFLETVPHKLRSLKLDSKSSKHAFLEEAFNALHSGLLEANGSSFLASWKNAQLSTDSNDRRTLESYLKAGQLQTLEDKLLSTNLDASATQELELQKLYIEGDLFRVLHFCQEKNLPEEFEFARTLFEREIPALCSYTKSNDFLKNRISRYALLLYAPRTTKRAKLKKSNEAHTALLTILEGNSALDFPHKLDEIGKCLQLIQQGPLDASCAWAYLAAQKWLSSHNQLELAKLCLETYRKLAVHVSQGRSLDHLGHFRTRKVADLHIYTRIFKMAATSRKALRHIGKNSRSHIGSQEEIEKLLIDACLDLRGPALKALQLLPFFAKGLTPEKKFYLQQRVHEGTQLPQAVVVKILKQEFGPNVFKEVFSFFDFRAVGIGSLSQVHRALLLDGSEVAVKIKLPHIEKIIDHDFAILKWMTKLLSVKYPSLKATPLVRNIQKHILGECDFKRELDHLTLFHEAYKDDSYIESPAPYPKLCTEKVLVMDFMYGQPIEMFLENNDEKVREHLARTLMRHHIETTNRGCFNSDPNNGNFLVNQGRLVLLDFGSVLKAKPKIIALWKQLTEAMAHNDLPTTASTMGEMGLLIPQEVVQSEEFQSLFHVYSADAEGNWAQQGEQLMDLKVLDEQLVRFAKFAPKHIDFADEEGLPLDLFLLLRSYFGNLTLSAQFQARSDWRSLILGGLQLKT